MNTDETQEKEKRPGYVFVTYNHEEGQAVKPVHLEIRPADTAEKQYMSETATRYLPEKRIPDLRIARFDHDDIGRLPPSDLLDPGLYLDANPSIQAQNKDRVIWHRSVIEAAYCIENGRDDYTDSLTSGMLMFDPKYALYRVVNNLGLRHFYRDMDKTERSDLLRRLNEGNPKLELKSLPKIGTGVPKSGQKKKTKAEQQEPGVTEPQKTTKAKNKGRTR